MGASLTASTVTVTGAVTSVRQRAADVNGKDVFAVESGSGS